MLYATQNNLLTRLSMQDLIELTSDDNTLNAAVVTAKLTEASAVVDAYCSNRYVVPLQPSVIANSLTLDIAVYKLATNRRDTRITETWTQQYQAAIQMLKDIATGKASLDIEAAAPAQQLGSGEVTTPTKHQTFDEHHLRGFC